MHDIANASFAAGENEPMVVLHWLEQIAVQLKEDLFVACERFILGTGGAPKTFQPDALEVIGGARYISWKWGCVFALQDVSAAKKMVPNPTLRALGMYTPKLGHANDAARHLVLGLVSQGWYSSALDG
jgi:hypothetical protein